MGEGPSKSRRKGYPLQAIHSIKTMYLSNSFRHMFGVHKTFLNREWQDRVSEVGETTRTKDLISSLTKGAVSAGKTNEVEVNDPAETG